MASGQAYTGCVCLNSELWGLKTTAFDPCCVCIFPLDEELLEISKPQILSVLFSLWCICPSQILVNISFVWCGMLSQVRHLVCICRESCPWAWFACFIWLCPWTNDSSCTNNEDASWFSFNLPQALPKAGGSLTCADAHEILWWEQADLIWVHQGLFSTMSLFGVWLCSLF